MTGLASHSVSFNGASRWRRARDLRRRHETAETALAEAQRKFAHWQAEWAIALTQLGRPGGENSGVTSDILALLAELERDRQAATQLDERLRAMRTDNDAFTAAVGTLIGGAAQDLDTPDGTTPAVLSALRTLRERLQEHRSRTARRAELQKQIEQADTRIAQLKHRLEQRQAELDAVLTAIGATSVEEAEQRLAASRERAAHADALARSEARLREDGDGLAIEEARDELGAFPADDIAEALVAAEATMGTANSAAQDAAARASRHKLQMDERAGDLAFEIAVADQQSEIAMIDRVTGRSDARAPRRWPSPPDGGSGGAGRVRWTSPYQPVFRTLSGVLTAVWSRKTMAAAPLRWR